MGLSYIWYSASKIFIKKNKYASWLHASAVSAVSGVSAELLNWSVRCSPLLSSPQSKEKKRNQKWLSLEFWVMLTSLQPSPPAKVGRRCLTTHLSTHPCIAWMSCCSSRVDWHLLFFAFVVVTKKRQIKNLHLIHLDNVQLCSSHIGICIFQPLWLLLCFTCNLSLRMQCIIFNLCSNITSDF